MSTPTSISGRELYALLPAVYRERDSGDLAGYLDAFGALFDRLRATLEQRLADCFPVSPEGEPQAQGWLLPYFADLLDVRLLSPYPAGRRSELARAIAWRQRKGTLGIVAEIARTVGQIEVEIQEGWKRVAITPVVGSSGSTAAAGLPFATVDLRLASRAAQAEPSDPLARTGSFAGREVTWRPLAPTGVPCFPGSFEDASRRTVDLRTPSWRQGHIHPRRLLLFLPPPAGFFPLDPRDRVTVPWPERAGPVAERVEGTTRRFAPARPDGPRVTLTAGAADGPSPSFAEDAVEIEDLNFLATVTVTRGRLTLRRVAAKKVVLEAGAGEPPPVLDATDCLFDEVEARSCPVRLEGCTVRGPLACGRLEASDCLFAGEITLDSGSAPLGCVRFSRVPPSPGSGLRRHATTPDAPVFFALDFCDPTAHTPRRASAFGDPGYGCLHPATPDSIRFGAEDGGEMGAGHHRAESLALAAVAAKLEEFLPMGLEAVLIPDARRLAPPPGTPTTGTPTTNKETER